MIEIKFAEEKEAMALCKTLAQKNMAATKVYVASEHGREIGACGFRITGNEGAILFCRMFEEDSIPIMDGLLRASAAYMAEAGVLTALCPKSLESPVTDKIGFENKYGKYVLDLNRFMGRGCRTGR